VDKNVRKQLIIKELMAEMVGFEARPSVENKELPGFSISHDPPDPLESPGGDTY
jgi:hypothetical protein